MRILRCDLHAIASPPQRHDLISMCFFCGQNIYLFICCIKVSVALKENTQKQRHNYNNHCLEKHIFLQFSFSSAIQQKNIIRKRHKNYNKIECCGSGNRQQQKK